MKLNPTRLFSPEGEPTGSSGAVAPSTPPGGSGYNPFDSGPPVAPARLETPESPAPPAATPVPDGSRAPDAPPSPSGAVAPQQGTVAPATTPPQSAIQQIVMTPEMLAQITAQRQQSAQPQPQPQPQLSEADFVRHFNIFQANDQVYESILGVKPDRPEQVKALDDALQGVARQAVTIARFEMANKVKELQAQLQPINKSLQQQKETEYATRFYAQNTDLKDYEPMLREIVDAARARNMKFASDQEAMKYVADTARRLLGKTVPVPGQAPGSVSNPAQTIQAPGARQMTPVSMGGRSGQGGATPPKSTAERIFG